MIPVSILFKKIKPQTEIQSEDDLKIVGKSSELIKNDLKQKNINPNTYGTEYHERRRVGWGN